MNISKYYNEFYTRAEKSAAHALLCRRVYGRNLCQHGMADMLQLEALLTQLAIQPTDIVLDLGCGNGYITEYLYDHAPAQYVGMDLSEAAIQQAQKHTATQSKKLKFVVGDFSQLDYPMQSFDKIVSIDSHYFLENAEPWLQRLYSMLRNNGKLAIFSDEGTGQTGYDDTDVSAAETLMGQRFSRLGYEYTAVNFTNANQAHWRLKKQIIEELFEQFADEDNLLLYDNRLNECTSANHNLDCRYLYIVHKR